MVEVESSNITSVGYDVATEEMRIQFASGGLYTYPDVPMEVAEDFVGAESVGKFFFSNIRSQYEGTRVVEEDADE